MPRRSKISAEGARYNHRTLSLSIVAIVVSVVSAGFSYWQASIANTSADYESSSNVRAAVLAALDDIHTEHSIADQLTYRAAQLRSLGQLAAPEDYKAAGDKLNNAGDATSSSLHRAGVATIGTATNDRMGELETLEGTARARIVKFYNESLWASDEEYAANLRLVQDSFSEMEPAWNRANMAMVCGFPIKPLPSVIRRQCVDQ